MKTAALRTPDRVDARTRDRVARLLLEEGPTTAAALGRRLSLSPAAVRRHLDALTADGTVVAREPYPQGLRARGRPARVFALSERGRAQFPHAYDDLAVSALRFLRDAGGEGAVEQFATARLAAFEGRYRERLAGSTSQRTQALASALTDDGYAARAVERGGGGAGTQLCQHHCPVHHVAAQFPQLCEAETAFFAKVLGTHVQRLATIAHGDGVCTTYIPRPDIARPDRARTDTGVQARAVLPAQLPAPSTRPASRRTRS